MNDYQFKLARLEGDFIWHDHPETDETFIVLEGTLRLELEDGVLRLRRRDVRRSEGSQAQAVRRGRGEADVDRAARHLNTGHESGERTAQNDVWI